MMLLAVELALPLRVRKSYVPLEMLEGWVIRYSPCSSALSPSLIVVSPFFAESPVWLVPLVYAPTSPESSEKGRKRSRAVKVNLSSGVTSNSALIPNENLTPSERSFKLTLTASPGSTFVGDIATVAAVTAGIRRSSRITGARYSFIERDSYPIGLGIRCALEIKRFMKW